jgi:hypothetical protein
VSFMEGGLLEFFTHGSVRPFYSFWGCGADSVSP